MINIIIIRLYHDEVGHVGVTSFNYME